MADSQDLVAVTENRSKDILGKLEDSSMELLEEVLTDVRSSAGEALRAVPEDELRACLYMASLRVMDFIREEMVPKIDVGAEENFKRVFLEGAFRIVDAIDSASPYTEGQSRTVASYAGQIAARAKLSDAEIEEVEYAALICNIGRVNESPRLIESKRKLSDSELNQARDHSVVGAEILRPISFLTPIVPMVRHHHTRFDGTGYASGARGESIPMGARIITIADAYVAMRRDRPYRSALSREQTLAEIDKNAGKQFDPRLIAYAHDIWED